MKNVCDLPCYLHNVYFVPSFLRVFTNVFYFSCSLARFFTISSFFPSTRCWFFFRYLKSKVSFWFFGTYFLLWWITHVRKSDYFFGLPISLLSRCAIARLPVYVLMVYDFSTFCSSVAYTYYISDYFIVNKGMWRVPEPFFSISKIFLTFTSTWRLCRSKRKKKIRRNTYFYDLIPRSNSTKTHHIYLLPPHHLCFYFYLVLTISFSLFCNHDITLYSWRW